MNDLEFVQRCVKGDKRSWGEFVEKYSRLIYNYILKVLNSKLPGRFSKEDVSDIFQEIFILLSRDNFKKLKTFQARNECSLATWLRQVVIHFTIDYLRRFRALVSLDEEDDNEFTLKDTLVYEGTQAKDMLVVEERIEQLKDCISQLDIEDKYFLELYIHRGLNLEELKDALKISRGAADMRKSRIIDRLRECFRNKGFELDF